MQKPNHLSHNPILELAWWIEETAVQFRLTGKGYTIPPNSEEAKKVIEAIGLEGEEANVEFWEKKREQVWGEFSGHLRGSFGRPPPGRKLEDVKEKPEDWTVRLDTSSVSWITYISKHQLTTGRPEAKGRHRTRSQQLCAHRHQDRGG